MIMTTIETIKKNNTEIKIGIGSLTKNPMVVTERELNSCYRTTAWFQYDGYWYCTHYETIEELKKRFNNIPTYSKEQLFDLVYEIIYGKYKG